MSKEEKKEGIGLEDLSVYLRDGLVDSWFNMIVDTFCEDEPDNIAKVRIFKKETSIYSKKGAEKILNIVRGCNLSDMESVQDTERKLVECAKSLQDYVAETLYANTHLHTKTLQLEKSIITSSVVFMSMLVSGNFFQHFSFEEYVCYKKYVLTKLMIVIPPNGFTAPIFSKKDYDGGMQNLAVLEYCFNSYQSDKKFGKEDLKAIFGMFNRFVAASSIDKGKSNCELFKKYPSLYLLTSEYSAEERWFLIKGSEVLKAIKDLKSVSFNNKFVNALDSFAGINENKEFIVHYNTFITKYGKQSVDQLLNSPGNWRKAVKIFVSLMSVAVLCAAAVYGGKVALVVLPIFFAASLIHWFRGREVRINRSNNRKNKNVSLNTAQTLSEYIKNSNKTKDAIEQNIV
ncbi:MAG: hypothetical protein COB50_05480 [Thiotrichales bacterium]|nr:MAG: hypothetical protein COB50_05480 [Thiotrichales bacterium]